MYVITAYREVGTYRGAAEMCGVSHKTVKRIIDKGRAAAERTDRRRNCESVRALVAHEMTETKGKIRAKRLLPTARAGGHARLGPQLASPRRAGANQYRQRQAVARSRRPAVWSPGEHLAIDWGVLNGLHVLCAVLAWSQQVRFVGFADNERADTTLALLAECFQVLGGVPKVVLADARSARRSAGVPATASPAVNGPMPDTASSVPRRHGSSRDPRQQRSRPNGA